MEEEAAEGRTGKGSGNAREGAVGGADKGESKKRKQKEQKIQNLKEKDSRAT